MSYGAELETMQGQLFLIHFNECWFNRLIILNDYLLEKSYQQYFEDKFMQGQSSESHSRQQDFELFQQELNEVIKGLVELEMIDFKNFQLMDFKKLQQKLKQLRNGLSEINQLIRLRERKQGSIYPQQKSSFRLVQWEESQYFLLQIQQSGSIEIDSMVQESSSAAESQIQLVKQLSNDYEYLKPKFYQNLQQINLINNLLKDQGIQYLSRKKIDKMEYLRSINLNGNDISVLGLGHLVLNSWHKSVVYVLDVVKIKEDHYGFHAGESIKIMKDCLRQRNTQINHDQIDRLQRQNKAKLFQALYLMLLIPFQTFSSPYSPPSEQIQQQLQNQSKTFINSESILLILKNLLKPSEVSFSQKTNIRSQLSMKVLLSGMQHQRIMFEYIYHQKSYIFDKIKENPSKMIEFQSFIKVDLAQKYGFSFEDIIIHKVFKVPAKVCFSLDFHQRNFQPKKQSQAFLADLTCGIITVVPYFQSFNLTQDDLSNDSERIFNFFKKDINIFEYRGGAPYFPPILAKRFGIKTKDKYDNKNSRWIEMDGLKGQWPVCYKSIRSPDCIVRDSIIKLKCMMGRQKEQMKESAEIYKYWQDWAVNKPDQQLGLGIQCSPLSTAVLQFATPCERNGETYYILLQARCKPEAIKIAQQQQYWIINESCDIRPYGFILVTLKQYQQLKDLAKQRKLYHNDHYRWEFWKKQFQEFQKQL